MTKETDDMGEWDISINKKGVKIRHLIKPSQVFLDMQSNLKGPEPPEKSVKDVLIEKGLASKNDFKV